MRKLFTLILLLPVLAAADNRYAIQALQEEPASLLDIAMLRLQDFIVWTQPNMVAEYNHAAQAAIRHVDINAYFVAESSHIQYSVSLQDSKSVDEQKQAGCDRVLDITQINLLKGLPGLFIHDDGRWPPGLQESKFNLANLIELSCVVHGNSTEEVFVRSSRPLALPTGNKP